MSKVRPVTMVAGAIGIVGLVALWQFDRRERARSASEQGERVGGVSPASGGGTGGRGVDGGSARAISTSGRYVCDMHCEPGKVLKTHAKCPVCNMAFRPWEDVGYTAAVEALGGGEARAGMPVRLLVRMLDPSGLDARVSQMPDGRLRVNAFSDDLTWSWSGSAKPLSGNDKHFEVTFAPPKDGEYVVFAEAMPAGETSVKAGRGTLRVGPPPAMASMGEPREPAREDYDMVKRAGTDGQYEIRVRCNGKRFFAGEDSFVRVGVDLGGATVTNLEPLTEGVGSSTRALGRLSVVSTDTTFFATALPMPILGGAMGTRGVRGAMDPRVSVLSAEQISAGAAIASLNGGESDLVFMTRFPRPGMYKVIVEMKHAGQMIGASFLIDAQAGEGGASEPAPMDHSKHAGTG